MFRIFVRLKNVVMQALANDMINTAKAAAYSGMLMLFPALLVLATLLARVPQGTTLVGEIRATFEQVLPADALDMLQSYVLTRHIHSSQVILSATSLSIFAALGVMLSLMEGFRRAYRLPPDSWSFWGRRFRALLLVPIALVPLSMATLVIVFGHQIEHWMIDKAGHELRHIVLFFWRMVRWSVALLTSATVLTALYHFGTRRKEHWMRVVPAPSPPRFSGSRPRWPSAGMSRASLTTPCSTALSAPASPLLSGSTSPPSASSLAPN